MRQYLVSLRSGWEVRIIQKQLTGRCVKLSDTKTSTCDLILLKHCNNLHGFLGIQFFFFLNFWRTWVLFVGPLIPLFWTSGDVSSGFQSQSRFCLIRTWRRCTSNITHSLRFTSGAAPADLLAASMAAEPISSIYLWRHWWESNGRPLAPWANAQPTELCWLGFWEFNFNNPQNYSACRLDEISNRNIRLLFWLMPILSEEMQLLMLKVVRVASREEWVCK